MQKEAFLKARPFLDAHCHLGFLANETMTSPENSYLSMTVTPHEYESAKKRFSHYSNVIVGAGLHPRWIADEKCSNREVKALCDIISQEKLIGEVGLDFLRQYKHSKEEQAKAFRQIINQCVAYGEKVISIHALRSTSAVLDEIESSKATRGNVCILHWFSGSNDELWRAIKLGCWFSVNEKMLNSKKGREYSKVIPNNRILLESDLPSDPKDMQQKEIDQSLENALIKLAEIRGEEIIDNVSCNSRELFSSLQHK